jgi:formylglycine-generating enzyme required for sulfatase activity
MGSPLAEPERNPENEPPHRMIIPRRFAIADREVTIEQFQRFLRTQTKRRLNVPPASLNRFSPDSDGPQIGPDWYAAAHYCNWLSEQEEIPKDQWCYLPNEAGVYAEGMTIPANVLERTGYRLPTDAEWEYACRAGTMTGRYYGLTTDLLGKYAWYQVNSQEHAWSCGSLLPNDLGLFDMLGNAYEWVNDRNNAQRPWAKGTYYDYINRSDNVIIKYPRLIRGGGFTIYPSPVRSADRNWFAPSNWDIYNGFRLFRTYK